MSDEKVLFGIGIDEIMKLIFSQTFFTHTLPPLVRVGNHKNIKNLVPPTLIRGRRGCVSSIILIEKSPENELCFTITSDY